MKDRLTSWNSKQNYAYIKGYTPSSMYLTDDAIKRIQAVVNRLAYYEDMEEQGKISPLPCNVNDTVYLPWNYRGLKGIALLTVTHIIFDRDDSYIKTDFDTDDNEYYNLFNGGKFYFSEIGTLIFLNEEDAKMALADL